MKNIFFTLFFSGLCFVLLAQKVAFVGVNIAAPDGFAFVAMENLMAGEQIYFTSDEYDAASNVFVMGLAEEVAVYTVGAGGLAAGQVVFINETSSNTFAVTCSAGMNCGTFSVILEFFSIGGNDELYLYTDTDANPYNGVTEIHAAAYYNFNSIGTFSFPAANDPSGDFPDAIVLDGFTSTVEPPDPGVTDQFQFTPALRSGMVDIADLENPANYTLTNTEPSPALSTTPFTNLQSTDPCAMLGGDSDSDGTCDNNDGCPNDPNKIAPGTCGCNVIEADANGNGMTDCTEAPKAAIVGVNENDPEGFSFVALVSLPVGTRIYFTTNEYNAGFGTFSSGEEVGYFQATSVIAPGTVVVIKETAVNVLTADCCGTATVVSGNFTFGDEDELYLYLDNNTDPIDGVTNIYSVAYWNHNTVGAAPLPAANDPSGQFPNVYILDNLPDGGTAGQFEYTVSKRGCGLPTQAQLEDPTNYTLGTTTPSPDLNSTDFTPDTQAPMITCPAPTTVSCVSELAAYNPNLATAMDNCTTSLTITGSRGALTGGACGGTITETYMTMDAAGNPASCMRVITVDDNTNPMITCPGNTTAECNETDPSFTGTPTGSDNCGATPTFTSSDVVGVGTITRTWKATDACNNMASCMQTITVVDNVDPVAMCQDVTVQLDAGGDGTLTAAEVNNNSSDNCGTPGVSINNTMYDCADVGVMNLTVTLTATDIGGNTHQCTADVTVVDDIDPVANCQDVTVQLDAGGDGTLTAAEVNNNSSDNCSGFSLSINNMTYACADVGVANLTVTLTVTDVGGNTDQCTADVTVVDNIDPVAMCQDVTVQLDASGNGTLTEAEVNNGSSDNCGTPSLGINNTTFDCTDVGVMNLTVTLTATDIGGNTHQCTADVTVVDDIDPVADCQDVTVFINLIGQGILTAAEVNDNSTDNCSPLMFSIDNDMYECDDIGVDNLTVTLTVTDVGGNTDQCTANVTVLDQFSPVIQCQDITVQLDADGEAMIDEDEVSASAMDACGGELTFDTNINTFGCDDLAGPVTVMLTVTDQYGNAAGCMADVTVEDNVDPVAVCQNISVLLNAAGIATISESAVSNGSSDACGPLSFDTDVTAYNCSNLGPNSVTLTVSDGSGNSAMCGATVTVQDMVAPTAVCQNITVQLNAAGTATISESAVNNGSSDACGPLSFNTSTTSFNCSDVGANPVTLTVSDGSNNSAMCGATVTVQDMVAPTAVCQNITVQLNGMGQATISESAVNNGSSDACGPLSFDTNITSFDCDDVSTPVMVTLMVTDDNGNSSTCTATVTVQDNAPPTAQCQDVTLNLTSDGITMLDPAAVDDGSFTACGGFSISLSKTDFGCDDIGPVMVTLTVTDDSNGQTDDCTATVTVADPQSYCCAPPLAVCQNITVQLNAQGQASIMAIQVDGGSTAECGLLSRTVDPDQFNCSHVGPNTVTLTITDINNESDDCTAIVTVQDNVDPTAICKNITVQLNAAGTATIAENAVNNGSSDACGGLIFDTNVTSFGCANVGNNMVTLTVTDANDNSAMCTATVTVQDLIAPTVMCSGGTVTFNGQPSVLTSSAVMVTSSDACGVASTTYSPATITCSQVGQNVQVIVKVTDVNGNMAQCTTSVQVNGFPCGFMDTGGIGCSSQASYNAAGKIFTLQTNNCNYSSPYTDTQGFIGYQLCGNGSISFRVASVSSTSVFAGISLRASTAPGAIKAEVVQNLYFTARASVRTVTNGAAWPQNLFLSGQPWMRLDRQGNQVSIYTSADGVNWNILLVRTLTLPSCVQVGMLAYGPGMATATFDDVKVNGMSLLAGGTPPSAAADGDFRLHVYPNPTTGQVTVEMPVELALEGATLEVLDAYGRTLLRETTLDYRQAVDVSHLPAGAYFLRLQTADGERMTERVLVQH